jgi:signal transduction histidine kinase
MESDSRYSCDVPAPGGTEREIEVDPRQVQEVLAILIDNALKFSPEGSEVKAWYEQDVSQTTFFVADRGPGVPDEDRQKIFERFYQVEGVQHHSKPGLGLGLYVAKRFVEAHGGSIELESRDGGGSLFSFTIPSA